MDWSPYQSCCHRSALDEEALRCPECGHLLLRCPGFRRCLKLLDRDEACDRCLAPRLWIPEGARLGGKVGDQLSIPLQIHNASVSKRPLRIRKVVVSSVNREPEPLPLGFETLKPGESRGFPVDLRRLERGGIEALLIRLVLATRPGHFEESYAFEGHLRLEIEGADDRRAVQVINVSGGGSVVATGPTAASSWKMDGGENLLRKPAEISLSRAERFEIDQGIRGVLDGTSRGLRVFRDLRVLWSGLPPADRPEDFDDRPFLRSERLRCGRNSRRFDAQRNPEPNDVCLRVYDPRSGRPDREACMRISGHHFDLLVRGDCLQMQSHAGGGSWHNDQKVEVGESAVLRDGDLISPFAPELRCLRFRVSFVRADGVVSSVRIAPV